MTISKKIAIAAMTALAIIGGSFAATSSADARPGARGFHGGHHGAFRGGFRGRGLGLGFGTGLALGGLGYYGYNSYYGDCFVQRRVFVDHWGRRFVRPVRICS